MTQTVEHNYTPAQRHMRELHRLHRTVDLNVRYYGARAFCERRSSRYARIVGAVGSSTAIVGVFAGAPSVLLILSAATALSTILAPLFLWDQKATLFEKLHFGYGDLLQDFKNLIRNITIAGGVTEQHLAVASVLFERFSRLSPLDEPRPDRSLIARFEIEVKQAIPATSLWMPPTA